MKTKQVIGLFLFLAAIISTSCSKNGAELLIPQSAVAVITTNPADLAKKGGTDLNNALKKINYDAIYTPGVSAIIKSLMEDPTSSGVNLTSDLYVYVDDVNAGLAIQLSRESKFKALIEKLQKEGVVQPMEQKEGLTVASIDAQTTLYFDADRALITMQAKSGVNPIEQFKQTEKNSIIAQEGYKKLKSDSKDINIWMDYSVFKTIKNFSPELAYMNMADIPNMDIQITTEFVKGKIVFKTKVYPKDDKAKDALKQGAGVVAKTSSKFLPYLPKESFIAMNTGVDFTKYLALFEQNPQTAEMIAQVPTEVKDLLNYLGGSVTGSLMSVDRPSYVIYIETKQAGFLNQLENAFGPMLRRVSANTLLFGFGNEIYLTEGKNYVCITSESAIAANPETEVDASFKKEDFYKALSKSDMLSMALRMPDELSSIAPDLKEFKLVEMQADDIQSGTATVYMNNTQKNSLAVLMELAAKMAQ